MNVTGGSVSWQTASKVAIQVDWNAIKRVTRKRCSAFHFSVSSTSSKQKRNKDEWKDNINQGPKKNKRWGPWFSSSPLSLSFPTWWWTIKSQPLGRFVGPTPQPLGFFFPWEAPEWNINRLVERRRSTAGRESLRWRDKKLFCFYFFFLFYEKAAVQHFCVFH